MNDTIKKISDLIPLIVTLIPVDCIITLTDTEKIIYAYSTVAFEGVTTQDAGQPIHPESPNYQAMKHDKIIHTDIPKEVFGTPFRTTGIPLKEVDGTITGSVFLGISIGDKQILENTADILAHSTQEVSYNSQELAEVSARLADHVNDLADAGKTVGESLKSTDEILRFIYEISNNSNLLGLNAAIEAARAGEYGRGFSVVAQEIRKMADNSADSVKRITASLNLIRNQHNTIAEKVNDLLTVSGHLASAAQEIAGSMEELNSSTENIRNVAMNLYTKKQKNS